MIFQATAEIDVSKTEDDFIENHVDLVHYFVYWNFNLKCFLCVAKLPILGASLSTSEHRQSYEFKHVKACKCTAYLHVHKI